MRTFGMAIALFSALALSMALGFAGPLVTDAVFHFVARVGGYAVAGLLCFTCGYLSWCRLRENQKARRLARAGETVTIHISLGERPYPGVQPARERFGDADGQSDYSTYLEARQKIERARKASWN